MTMIKRSTLKTAVSTGLIVALLGTTAGCTAVASGYDNQPVYRDNNFGRISQQLRQDLRRNGYYVMDIKADGRNKIDVYAKKNNQPYELKYTYPALKLISSHKKGWSNVWEDKKNHNGNDGNRHYGNNKYGNKHHSNGYYGKNRTDDVEDNIKKQARYPAIKQRAIRKMNNMGYRVKDIELDEKNNRGIFEIEAKRGGQDYEIEMSYPNLNVIKLERD